MQDPELSAFPTQVVPPPTPFRQPGDSPDITVYGYWPYWGDPLDTLQWDQLTHLAIFNVDLNSDGTLDDTHNWHNNADEALSLAAPYGVRVHVTLTCFDDNIMDSVLSSSTRRTRAANALRDLVNHYGAHGVNVDFEGLDFHLKDEFVWFIQELNGKVADLFIAMPAVDWSGAYDYDELAFASDGLFIMNYGYHWSGGDPGPLGPLYGGSGWPTHSIDWTVGDYQTWGAPADSLITGLPLYGYEWPSTSNSVPGTATGSGVSQAFSTAVANGDSYGRRWDASSHTPYAFRNSSYQLWYDDTQSIADKIEYAIDEGLQGVGFWALTYDNADPDLWGAIDGLTHNGSPTGGLSLDSPSPGTVGTTNTFSVTGAQSWADVAVVGGYGSGIVGVQGCPALEIPMNRAWVLDYAYTGSAGNGTASLFAPGNLSGRTIKFQALDFDNCELSDLVTHTFP